MKNANTSVIIPVYNAEKYIGECIKSVITQTSKVDEIILVNDGSSDNSGVLCDAYAKKDSRIKVIHKENGGAATARNAGLDVASGDYLMFVDGDDVLHPQTIEILYNLLFKENADMAMCYYDFFEGQCNQSLIDVKNYNSTILYGAALLNEYLDYFRKVSLISLCMKLYKREIFENYRIPEGYVEEDSMTLPYILERAKKIAKTDLKLYHWRVTPGSVTRSGFTPKQFAFIQVCNSNIEFFKIRKMKEQANFFKKEMLHRTLQYYYKIPENGEEFYEAFRPYMKNYRKKFLEYWFARGMCIRERLAYLIFLFSPLNARKLYVQVYGKDWENA